MLTDSFFLFQNFFDPKIIMLNNITIITRIKIFQQPKIVQVDPLKFTLHVHSHT